MLPDAELSLPQTVVILNRGKACAVCRRKKQRCDGAKPSCGPCAKIGKAGQCTYKPESASARSRELRDHLHALEGSIQVLKVKQPKGADRVANLTPMYSTFQLGTVSFSSSPKSSSPSPSPPKSLESSPSPPRSLRTLSSPGPLDVPASLRDPLPAMLKDQVPDSLSDILIDIFLENRWQHLYEFSTSRILAGRRLPPSHPDSIHPALLDAMCLLGCMYSRRVVFHNYEKLFLERLNRNLANSLYHMDRIYDFTMASTLKGCYYYMKGRVREGHYIISSTARFALACRLHQIDSCSLEASKASPLLGPPRDLVDLGDRIYLFWGLFCMDRIGSLIANLPSAFSKENEITTMWPCPPEYYSDGRAHTCSESSAPFFLRHTSEAWSSSKANNNVHAFRAKSVALLYRTAVLAKGAGDPLEGMSILSKNPQACKDIISDITVLEKSLSHLAASVEQYRLKCTLGNDAPHDAMLVFSIASIQAAYIHLCSILAEQDNTWYRRRLQAAKKSTTIIKEILATGSSSLHVSVCLMWTCVYEVLALEWSKLGALGDERGVALIQGDIDNLYGALELYAKVFPFKINLHIQYLKKFNIHGTWTLST
ncbi:hypothetical protein BOTBODRAFT_39020 [Botryobasidium botryosum FD-172 SS1]|uniref:Zn(2)-C6 fungal-type domain-containing protein n=1 Tax=Botryobasidium botryosum (strain FD-172 SS1) TaxID=930990 RepID=A0A067LV29_BOTB1|nr:hypothetical protein BOTBODRAFT_39020 [Botryobasidium botryosum FD-172 SS1]